MKQLEIKRSEEEVTRVHNGAAAGFESGDKYAQGVLDALNWLSGADIDFPVEEWEKDLAEDDLIDDDEGH